MASRAKHSKFSSAPNVNSTQVKTPSSYPGLFSILSPAGRQSIADDPTSSFNTDPDIPGNVERAQAQHPDMSRADVIAGLRAAQKWLR